MVVLLLEGTNMGVAAMRASRIEADGLRRELSCMQLRMASTLKRCETAPLDVAVARLTTGLSATTMGLPTILPLEMARGLS